MSTDQATNGTSARLRALEKQSEHVQDDIGSIHSRINELKASFEHLIGQLTMLKWLLGAGFLWFALEEIVARLGH